MARGQRSNIGAVFILHGLPIPFLWNDLFGNVLTTEDPLGISSEETASCGKFSVSLRDKSLVNDDIL